MQDNDNSPALTLTGLSKTFPGTKALDSVDLTVRAGEIHALIGQNGSGKSTVVKILAGYHEPDDGGVAAVNGVPFQLGSAAAALAAGLRFVHQDLGLIETTTVAENFRLGVTSFSLGRVRRVDDRADAQQALAKLGYDIAPDMPIAALAESERTAVGLARALYAADTSVPFQLLVLDEVTASLPGAEAQRLFTALRRIAAGGTAILFISHHLDEVLDLCDQVTVLRDGKLVASVPVSGLSGEQLAELLLGRRLQAELAAHTRIDVEQTTPTMQVSQLSGSTLAPFDFELFPGEVLGIAGLTACGVDAIEATIADLTGGNIAPQVVSYLQAHKDVKYVYAFIGDLATGLPQALKAAGMSDVKIMGAVPNVDQIQSLIDKTSSAWLALPRVEGAWQVVDAMARYSEGMDFSIADTIIPRPIFTQDNVTSPATDYAGVPDFEAQFKALWGV